MPALLAFCNDVDFSDRATSEEVRRILGSELGIAAEDSFWIFDPNGSERALFKRSLDEKGPRHEEVLEEIASGRLSILHGAGNFDAASTDVRAGRALVAGGLAYLRERARVPRVWTNHGDPGNVQNIGAGAPTYHEGDDPGSGAYVLDLLLQSGVRYFWADHHATNTFSLSADPTSRNPLVVRERARSGHSIECFFRYRGALPKAPDAQTLGLQLTRENLDRLVETEGACVIYQHWCVHRDGSGRPFTAGRPVFPEASLAGLRHVAGLRDRGLLRVLPVAKLLDECAGPARARAPG